MRRNRILCAAAILALGLPLAGCETATFVDKVTDLGDSLADLMPFGTRKTPLPGERRAVFPEGVPGVPQGVPPDMVKGYQPPPEPPPPVAEPQREKPKPKKVVQPRPPQRPKPKAQPAEPAAPAASQQAAPRPAPSGGWPAPGQPAQVNWPPPPPPSR